MAIKSELGMKVNIDVSETITGLKAVQREAKEAVKAIRELEEASKEKDSKLTVSHEVARLMLRYFAALPYQLTEEYFTPKYLSSALASFTGVRVIILSPEESISMTTWRENCSYTPLPTIQGPARILINED